MNDIIVTGGRDYVDRNYLETVLSLFDIGLLIQGGASGADRLARGYAEDNNIECITVNADWNKHGRAAGPIRNREMIERYPNAIIVAFPGGNGTKDCVRTAVLQNRVVLMVHGPYSD